jgi:hypothetical protein
MKKLSEAPRKGMKRSPLKEFALAFEVLPGASESAGLAWESVLRVNGLT